MTARNFITSLLPSSHRLRAMLSGIAAAMILVGLMGCAATDEPLPDPNTPGLPADTDDRDEYISLIVDTQQRSASRADTWGDDYESTDATAFENRIDPQKIHILIYDSAGKLLGTVTSAPPAEQVKIYHFIDGNPSLYQVVFNASDIGIVKGRDYMAAVVANIGSAYSPKGIDGVTFNQSALTGRNPADGVNYYGGAMPMFGFLRWHMGSFEQLEGQLNGFPSIGTVHMLRSVAKIEVALTNDFDKHPKAQFMTFDDGNPPRFSLAGRHLNALGNIAPAFSKWRNKQTTTQLSFNDSFNENTSSRMGSASDNILFHATSADGRMRYIYVPEASGDGMSPNESPLRLDVTVSYNNPDEGSGEPRTITGTLFPSIPYDDSTGRPVAGTDYTDWRLTRNHIYRFTITDFADETSLRYEVRTTQQQTIEVPDFN